MKPEDRQGAWIVWDMGTPPTASRGGDWRLRAQGYAAAGMGFVQRYMRSRAFWAPHVERTRREILAVAAKLEPQRGGTLLVLGAGRLLDIPWQELFPRFERVVLVDADYTIVPVLERAIAESGMSDLPRPVFEIGDVTGSVVDTSALAARTIRTATNAHTAARELARAFTEAALPLPSWASSYADVRLAISANVLAELAHFPRVYVESEFRRRFEQPFDEGKEAFDAYLQRVQAHHVQSLGSLANAWGFLSSDVRVLTYDVPDAQKAAVLTAPVPPNAGFDLDQEGDVVCHWDATIEGESEPLGGLEIRDLWPRDVIVDGPRRWTWHIAPQGGEHGRPFGWVHIVEAWTKHGI
jgi:hypothetical protein